MKKASPLKLARVARGLSQGQLAKKIGRHQTLISFFERGCILVNAPDQKKLARILKTSVEALFR